MIFVLSIWKNIIMFNERIRTAQEIIQIIVAIESTDKKYDDFKSNFTEKYVQDSDFIQYYIKGEENVFYANETYICDYDNSSRFNYICFIPKSNIIVFRLCDEFETIYEYELFKDFSEEQAFQYSTLYNYDIIEMMIMFWYFNQIYNGSFYINMNLFEKAKKIYERYHDFEYKSIN